MTYCAPGVFDIEDLADGAVCARACAAAWMRAGDRHGCSRDFVWCRHTACHRGQCAEVCDDRLTMIRCPWYLAIYSSQAWVATVAHVCIRSVHRCTLCRECVRENRFPEKVRGPTTRRRFELEGLTTKCQTVPSSSVCVPCCTDGACVGFVRCILGRCHCMRC